MIFPVKRTVSSLLLFGLWLMPFISIMIREYQILGNDLDAREVRRAIEEGEFDTGIHAAWTIVAFACSSLLFAPKLERLRLRKSNFLILLSFSSFILILLAKQLWDPSHFSRDLGAVLRYLNYFLFAPLLTLYALRSLKSIYIVFLGVNAAMVLYLVAPYLSGFNWAAVTYSRDLLGQGGATSRVGGAYMVLIYAVFLATSFVKRRGPILRLAEWSAIGAAVLVIMVTFSRGAILGLLFTFFFYLTFGKALRLSRIFLNCVVFVSLLLLVIVLSSESYLLLSRQGQLSSIDAGRIAIWEDTLGLATSSLGNLILGVDTDLLEKPAHNLFLGIMASYGVFALLAYTLFHISALRKVWRFSNTTSDRQLSVYGFRSFSVMVGVFFFANFENTFFLNANPMAYLYYYLVGLVLVLQSGTFKNPVSSAGTPAGFNISRGPELSPGPLVGDRQSVKQTGST